MTMGVGIIGAGRVSGAHAHAALNTPGARLVAVAEPETARREAFLQKYPCTGYADYRVLLDDSAVEIVMIGLPHWLHAPVAIAACQAGKHVFIEKPMAMTVAECDEMIAAAARARVKLMVGHTEHFTGASIAARKLVASGILGQIVLATDTWYKPFGLAARPPWFLDRAKGGGMWWMNGSHMVDRLSWLIGSPVTAVRAWIGNPMVNQRADDSAIAFLDFANGAHAVLQHTGYGDNRPEQCWLELIGTQASLRVETRNHGVWLARNGPYRKQQVQRSDDFVLELQGLVRAIQEDTDPPVDGRWGRHIVAALLACEESSRTGQVVQVPQAYLP